MRRDIKWPKNGNRGGRIGGSFAWTFGLKRRERRM